jgi:predicted amidohydrolase
MAEPISSLNVFIFKRKSFSSLDATAKNIGLIKSFVQEASAQGCHLCIFPECFLQGYAVF